MPIYANTDLPINIINSHAQGRLLFAGRIPLNRINFPLKLCSSCLPNKVPFQYDRVQERVIASK